MYFENRKFGDNQYRVLLLPPPTPSLEAMTSLVEMWAMDPEAPSGLKPEALQPILPPAYDQAA
jgi:hypothetical protein